MTNEALFSMIPIAKTNVYRSVISRITSLIDSGKLKAGDRLPSERDMAASLNISRTTLRQGIKVLESMGRLTTKIGSGTYVTEENILEKFGLSETVLDSRLLRSLCQAREGVELSVFRAFMQNARTKANLDALAELLDRQEKHIGRGLEADVVYEYEFERKTAELAGNPILRYQQIEIEQLWTYVWSRVGRVPEKRVDLHAEHKAILTAMLSGDIPRMEHLVSRHVNKSLPADQE